MERITLQKQIILDYLKSTTSHPTAEAVYLEVRKKLPKISLGTVYRIISFFKKNGKVIEISCNISHYDANISPHSHFICESCQKIFDIEIPNVKKLKEDSNTKGRKYLKSILGDFSKIGTISNYQIYFYGKCKKCSKK